MKTVCIFLCFVSAILFSNGIPLKIKAFNIEEHPQRTIASLQLSNNTIWNIFIEPENQLLLASIREEFEVESPVVLIARRNNPIMFIGKPDSCRSFRTGLAAESKKNLPNFEGIRKVIVEAGGWFSDPKYAYKLYLSDGSVWRREYLGNVQHWKKGDTILVSHQYEDGDYSLINLDADCEAQFSSGKIHDLRPSYWFFDHSSN